MSIRTILVCAVFASLPASVRSQDPPAPPGDPAVIQRMNVPIPVDPEGGVPLPLTLREALVLALQNNTGLKIDELRPYEAAENVRAARAVFEPELFADATMSRSREPARNIFQPNLESEVYTGRFGLRQFVPSGGLFDVAFSPTSIRQQAGIPGFPERQFVTDLTFSYTQPLLRGAWTDYNLREVHTQEALRAASAFQLEQATQDTLIAVVTAYWDLVFARKSYGVTLRALELATEQLERTDRKIRVGELAPLDRVADEAEVARRREELVTAESAIRDREDDLRRLLFDDSGGALWTRNLDPVTEIGEIPTTSDLDWRELALTAKRFRPDLRALRAGVAVAEIQLQAAQRDVLPRLDLIGSYTADGVGMTSQDAWQQTTGLDFPDWTLTLAMSVPIGNSGALALRDRARLEVERSLRELYSSELDVQLEVRDAVRRLRTLVETIAAGRESVRLAESNLRREIARKEAGQVTSFEVTGRTQELQDAINRLIRNELDYRIAEANMLHVQGLLEIERAVGEDPGDASARQK